MGAAEESIPARHDVVDTEVLADGRDSLTSVEEAKRASRTFFLQQFIMRVKIFTVFQKIPKHL